MMSLMEAKKMFALSGKWQCGRDQRVERAPHIKKNKQTKTVAVCPEISARERSLRGSSQANIQIISVDCYFEQNKVTGM